MQTARAVPALAIALAMLAVATSVPAQAKKEREAPVAAGQLGEVGKGQRMGRRELQPGAYITPRHRQAVQAYLARHHGAGKPCLPGLVKRSGACRPETQSAEWKIGVALPGTAATRSLPPGLLAALPKPPPGNHYVLLAGNILLVASVSRLVVDAVAADD